MPAMTIQEELRRLREEAGNYRIAIVDRDTSNISIGCMQENARLQVIIDKLVLKVSAEPLINDDEEISVSWSDSSLRIKVTFIISILSLLVSLFALADVIVAATR